LGRVTVLVFRLKAWIAPVVRAPVHPQGIDPSLCFAKTATLSLFWHLIALYLFQTLDLVLSLPVTDAL
jgi:hypothetical protein